MSRMRVAHHELGRLAVIEQDLFEVVDQAEHDPVLVETVATHGVGRLERVAELARALEVAVGLVAQRGERFEALAHGRAPDDPRRVLLAQRRGPPKRLVAVQTGIEPPLVGLEARIGQAAHRSMLTQRPLSRSGSPEPAAVHPGLDLGLRQVRRAIHWNLPKLVDRPA